MDKLKINIAENSYDILFKKGGLINLGEFIEELIPTKKCCLISQKGIFKYHGLTAYNSLRKKGYEVKVFMLPDGEQAKSNAECLKCYKFLLDNNFDRASGIIALGGGVVGDFSGFIASTYLRGIPYIQVPTTLLAAVDSSVGGKTAINFDGVKNVIGTFYQPRLVLIDTDLLSTLCEQEFTAGLAEVIKYAILEGEELFSLLEKTILCVTPVSFEMQEIIKKCCEVKCRIVEQDEKETSGQRMLLNLGHTMGHAVESAAKMRHGEAIAIGIVFASKYANHLGLLSGIEMERIIRLIKKAGLPWEIPKNLDREELKKLITKDKKNFKKQINWILPHKIGDVRIHPKDLEKMPKF